MILDIGIRNLTRIDSALAVWHLMQRMKISKMVEYYYLQTGDYIQSDDEVQTSDGWSAIDNKWFGRKYGYSLSGKRHKWAICRRLIPNRIVKKGIIVEIQEQWGEEFEI